MQEQVQFAAAGVRLAATRWRHDGRQSRGTLLFLHGGGQTRHAWRHSAVRFARQGWSAVTVDTRGHGDSDWAADGDYSMDTLVADAREVVADLEPPVVLVGASLGGMTALLLAGEAPGRAHALVLVDVVPRLEPEGVARIQAFMRARPEGFADLEEVAEAVRAYTPERTRPVNVEGLRKNVRRGPDGRWYWHWDPAFMTDERRHDHLDGERLGRAAANVEVPTLVIRGKQSDVVSDDGVEELLAVLPDAEVADVSGAGHMVAGDDNDVFTDRLADFLTVRVESAGLRGPR